MPTVANALRYSLEQTTVRRTALTLLDLNQTKGFDCPGCTWPEPDPAHRHRNEHCENGAEHVSDEAMSRRITAGFFREHPVSEPAERSARWLNQQGRLTEPMVKRPGSDHHEPIGGDAAFAPPAGEPAQLDSPDEAVFTSGRVSNEAAFLLQLFARVFGTNNLPHCSNMCHESSGFALHETLGVSKGSVSLHDLHHADLVLVVGQNPGSNHPRMLCALEETKRNGGRIVDVNPLPEAGLKRFRHPPRPRGPSASRKCWGIRSQMPMARSPRTLLWPRTGHTERRAEGFRLIAHPTAPGCAAACCPQTNVLVPLDSTAGISNTPTSKGIVVGPERTTIGAAGATATATAPRSDGP